MSQPPDRCRLSDCKPSRLTGTTSAVLSIISLFIFYGCDHDNADQDVTPPGTATLSIYNVASSGVTLSWKGPGDDGFIGTAQEYDIRCSRDSITNSNWHLATPISDPPRPGSPNYEVRHTIFNLDTNTVYYFALKTRDEVPGQWSLLSNSTRARTLPGLGKITHLAALDYFYYSQYSGPSSVADPPVIKGNILYASGTQGYTSVLCAVDIGNAEIPTVIGTLQFPSYAVYVDIFDNYAFVGGSRLWVVDITNPQAMDILGTQIVAGSFSDIDIDGNCAFLGRGDLRGFQVYDITDPVSPDSIGQYHEGLNCHSRIKISGNYAYLACGCDFRIIDITNRASPHLLGSYLACDGAYGYIYEIAISGDIAYLATLTVDFPCIYHLEIIDISNKTSPQRLALYESSSPYETGCFSYDAGGIAISGNYLYWTSGAGLTILDISNPASPRFAASCYATGSVVTDGSYIYVGALDVFQFTPFN